MKTIGVPAEVMGLPVAVADDSLRERVRMAEEWRMARTRQTRADEAMSRNAELDALVNALVNVLRHAPLRRLSEDGVIVMRPHHPMYVDERRWPRGELRDDLNARLEAAGHGVRVTGVTVKSQRALLHRVCECGCGLDASIDECPMECCCCMVWGAMCACLPTLYWWPRMCKDRGELIARWEIRVVVHAHP